MTKANACAVEEIRLWIHKGQVVTVRSSVLWSDHLGLCLKNQSDRSVQDNRVGMISKRHLFKSTLGSKCTLCCKVSRHPLEITTNATALRVLAWLIVQRKLRWLVLRINHVG